MEGVPGGVIGASPLTCRGASDELGAGRLEGEEDEEGRGMALDAEGGGGGGLMDEQGWGQSVVLEGEEGGGRGGERAQPELLETVEDLKRAVLRERGIVWGGPAQFAQLWDALWAWLHPGTLPPSNCPFLASQMMSSCALTSSLSRLFLFFFLCAGSRAWAPFSCVLRLTFAMTGTEMAAPYLRHSHRQHDDRAFS